MEAEEQPPAVPAPGRSLAFQTKVRLRTGQREAQARRVAWVTVELSGLVLRTLASPDVVPACGG